MASDNFFSNLDSDDAGNGARRAVKSEGAFRTISEVADELNVPQHVLRFWETKFTQIRPLKRGGGRRYYRPEDVTLLKRIRTLLYTDGLTIKGVQKLLRETGAKVQPEEPQVAVPAGQGPSGLPRAEAQALLAELRALRDDLHRAVQAA
ncbi:MAG: MerR family transcriptional regulator [Rhodospirillaceae bacterium]|nr:MerR family transcriptional regulator [Rhodospirillaceae bacterium]